MRKLLICLLSAFMALAGSDPDYQITQKPSTKPSTKSSSTPSGASLCPDGNHPHMIDLGLLSGTKWSCCNVGANEPDATGDYYSWGETETKSTYNDVSYKYSTGEDTDGDGWYDKNEQYQNLGSCISGTSYDVANVKWGGTWRMPTKEQRDELIDNCTYSWTTVNGVKGGMFTSKKNGKSIFLPAAGNRIGTDFIDSGSRGYYWSGTQYPNNDYCAYHLYFYSRSTYSSYFLRYRGRPVRPVSE